MQHHNEGNWKLDRLTHLRPNRQKVRFSADPSFILKPKKDIVDDMSEIIKSHEKDIEEFEKVKKHLIEKGKEKESQLQEAMKALRI